jgi:hypothetical protein
MSDATSPSSSEVPDPTGALPWSTPSMTVLRGHAAVDGDGGTGNEGGDAADIIS